jgi:glutaredoxin-related protein
MTHIEDFIKTNNILIYSKKCPHSLKIINHINNLNLDFEGIEITSKNKIPPLIRQIETFFNMKINYVPTIIVDSGEYMLSGNDIYDWFDIVSNSSNKLIENNTNDIVNNFKTVESFNTNFVNYNQTKNSSTSIDSNFKQMQINDERFDNVNKTDKTNITKSFEELLKARTNIDIENNTNKPKNINFETGEVFY